MMVGCDGCEAREATCSVCRNAARFEAPPVLGRLTRAERRAIAVFTRAGLDLVALSVTNPVAPSRPSSVRARASTVRLPPVGASTA